MTKLTHGFRIPKVILLLFPFLILLMWAVLFVVGSFTFDPDFGWHLRMGEIISTSGFPKTDPFSYTMPSYPYVDHEWLVDVVWHYLYPLIGLAGLSALFAFAVIGSFMLVIPWPHYRYALIPGMFFLSVMLTRFAVRPQVLSWFYFAIILYVTNNDYTWKKSRYFIPVLFLLWANTHGSFPFGLFCIVLYVCLRAFLNRVIDRSDIGIGLASLAATLITPYGSRMWWEAWVTISDRNLHTRIIEWLPSYVKPEFGSIATMAFVIILLLRFRSSISVFQNIILIVTGSMAVASLRHVPFFVLAGIQCIVVWFAELHTIVRKIKSGEKRFWLFVTLLATVSFYFLSIDLILSLRSLHKRTQMGSYPLGAIRYLTHYQNPGNIFTTYRWGGYLVWVMPDSKVFIDGRMTNFRMKEQDGSVLRVMDLYIGVLEGKNIHAVFDKYAIDRVMLPVYNSSNEQKSPGSRLKFFNDVSVRPLQLELERSGWVVVYQDDQALVYQRHIP